MWYYHVTQFYINILPGNLKEIVDIHKEFTEPLEAMKSIEYLQPSTPELPATEFQSRSVSIRHAAFLSISLSVTRDIHYMNEAMGSGGG